MKWFFAWRTFKFMEKFMVFTLHPKGFWYKLAIATTAKPFKSYRMTFRTLLYILYLYKKTNVLICTVFTEQPLRNLLFSGYNMITKQTSFFNCANRSCKCWITRFVLWFWVKAQVYISLIEMKSLLFGKKNDNQVAQSCSLRAACQTIQFLFPVLAWKQMFSACGQFWNIHAVTQAFGLKILDVWQTAHCEMVEKID